MQTNPIGATLLQYKGRRASVNKRDSEFYGWIVIDVEPLKEPERSISVIEEVTEEILVLNYFDAKEMQYIPLDKIITVKVILR